MENHSVQKKQFVFIPIGPNLQEKIRKSHILYKGLLKFKKKDILKDRFFRIYDSFFLISKVFLYYLNFFVNFSLGSNFNYFKNGLL